MIEMHSSADGQIAHDPYVRPLDEQLGDFGNPYDKVIDLLERIANFSERQREKVAPDIIDLSPSAGLQITSTFQLKTNLRIYGILLTGASGDQMQFAVGGRRWNIWSSGTPTFFFFPYTAMAGNDMTVKDITNAGAVAWSFMVFGYPEG